MTFNKVIKFIVLSVVITGISCSQVFAKDIELSLSYLNLLRNDSVLRDRNSSTAFSFDKDRRIIKSPFGAQASASFFATSLFDYVDFGIGIEGGVSIFDKYKLGSHTVDVNSGYDFSVAIGPVFRVNLGRRNSLFFFPGAQFNYRTVDVKTNSLGVKIKQKERNVAFNLDAGYRFWFLCTENYLMGLNFGVDWTLPISSYCKYAVDRESTLYRETELRIFKFYVGLSFNIGQRGVDLLSKSKSAAK